MNGKLSFLAIPYAELTFEKGCTIHLSVLHSVTEAALNYYSLREKVSDMPKRFTRVHAMLINCQKTLRFPGFGI